MEKKLGLGSAIAVCVGLVVATSCLLSLGQGVGLAGKWFVIPLAIVVILNVFLAFSFAELNSIMPNVEGGVGQYTLVSFGPAVSIISNVAAYVICIILAAFAEVSMCGMVINELFLPSVSPIVIGLALLLVLTLINLRGVDVFSKIQNVVVFLLVGSLVVMGIMSFFKLAPGKVIESANQSAPQVTGIGGLLSLAAMAFWLFIGIEFVVPVAKNLKNPKRDVLLSMILGLVILFVAQSLLGCGMTNYVDLKVLSSNSMPHMVFAEALAGKYGKVWMGIVTLLAGISTLNTILASTSTIVSGMAKEKMLPKFLCSENKYKAPNKAIIGVAIVLTILLVTMKSDNLVNVILAASCFWLTSYVITHASVLVLRKRYPDAPRNKKLVLGGVPQVIGILGCVYMIWNISSDPIARAKIFGIYAIILGLLVIFAIVWTKLIMKVNPFKAAKLDDILNNEVNLEHEEELTNKEVNKGIA